MLKEDNFVELNNNFNLLLKMVVLNVRKCKHQNDGVNLKALFDINVKPNVLLLDESDRN